MVLFEKFEVHDTLNPKLWSKDNSLLPEVSDKIFEIIEQFLETSEIDLPIVDARIVGSQASYNYTDESDLDIHLIANFDYIDAPDALMQALCNCLKSDFNSSFDISIRGIETEIYVEDINSISVSNGVYSIYDQAWVKFPKKIDSIPDVDISEKFSNTIDEINRVLKSNNLDKIEFLINTIYLNRKNALANEGEYGPGNQLFKEIKRSGYLRKLKDARKELISKKLTLEHFRLTEDSRSKLLSKSKSSAKGFQRFKKRVKSRVANTVKQYNSIDMNKLFKENVLTVDINVKGETDEYSVKISFGGFLQLLKDQIDKTEQFNLKAVTRALINGFNKDDVYIHCSCPDWQYRYAYYATKNNINNGDAETRPSDKTNPDDKLGAACKHVLLVLSNTSWILKVASTIYNYINYMQKHYEKLYADIIYPAIYGKKYEEPVQLDIFDDDTLDTDTATIDKSNKYAVDKTKFQKGNKQGIRFAPSHKDDDQITLFDEEPDEEESDI